MNEKNFPECVIESILDEITSLLEENKLGRVSSLYNKATEQGTDCSITAYYKDNDPLVFVDVEFGECDFLFRVVAKR